jgi:predicted double-glycine peptidase
MDIKKLVTRCLIFVMSIFFLAFLMANANAYNIPLRIQTDTSCGTTALAMALQARGEYHTQQFYDECAGRKQDERTKGYQIQKCARYLGYKYDNRLFINQKKLKSGDIVLYHVFGYDNDSDLHYSVIDSIEGDTIILANPWGQYDYYSTDAFKAVFTNQALVYRGIAR